MTKKQRELKRLRLDHGLTVKQAAEMLDVSIPTWNRWEGSTSRTTEVRNSTLQYFKHLLKKVGK